MTVSNGKLWVVLADTLRVAGTSSKRSSRPWQNRPRILNITTGARGIAFKAGVEHEKQSLRSLKGSKQPKGLVTSAPTIFIVSGRARHRVIFGRFALAEPTGGPNQCCASAANSFLESLFNYSGNVALDGTTFCG